MVTFFQVGLILVGRHLIWNESWGISCGLFEEEMRNKHLDTIPFHPFLRLFEAPLWPVLNCQDTFSIFRCLRVRTCFLYFLRYFLTLGWRPSFFWLSYCSKWLQEKSDSKASLERLEGCLLCMELFSIWPLTQEQELSTPPKARLESEIHNLLGKFRGHHRNNAVFSWARNCFLFG